MSRIADWFPIPERAVPKWRKKRNGKGKKNLALDDISSSPTHTTTTTTAFTMQKNKHKVSKTKAKEEG